MSNDATNAVYWERVLKALIHRFYGKGDNEFALRLSNVEILAKFNEEDWGMDYYHVYLIVQPIDFDQFVGKDEMFTDMINDVLRPTSNRCGRVFLSLPLPEVEENWRENVRAMIRGDKVVNQGNLVSLARYEDRGLYFRSKTEIKIARALERAGILYFPLPVACYNGQKKEPDFLVQSKSGRWGILEVQGDTYHPPATAAQDHERSRIFRQQGIPVEFYSASRCWEAPDEVVSNFLSVISKHG